MRIFRWAVGRYTRAIERERDPACTRRDTVSAVLRTLAWCLLGLGLIVLGLCLAIGAESHTFPITEMPRARQVPAVGQREESPEGPGRGGNKPLMRTRRHDDASPDRVTAGTPFPSLRTPFSGRSLQCDGEAVAGKQSSGRKTPIVGASATATPAAAVIQRGAVPPAVALPSQVDPRPGCRAPDARLPAEREPGRESFARGDAGSTPARPISPRQALRDGAEKNAGGSVVERYHTTSVLSRLSWAESRNNDSAIGPAGERGRFQFSATAWAQGSFLLRRQGRSAWDFGSAHDPAVATIYATTYIDWLRNFLSRSATKQVSDELLIAAWNLGPRGLRRAGFSLDRMPRKTKQLIHRYNQ